MNIVETYFKPLDDEIERITSRMTRDVRLAQHPKTKIDRLRYLKLLESYQATQFKLLADCYRVTSAETGDLRAKLAEAQKTIKMYQGALNVADEISLNLL